MKKINSWYEDYNIEEKTKGGGNADVYFVKNKLTGEKCALKELRYIGVRI